MGGFEYKSIYCGMKQLIRRILREHTRENGERFIWTKEEIQKVANQFEYPNDFKKNQPVAYRRAIENGWLQDVTAHMKRKREDWTKEKLSNLISKYGKLSDFRKNEPKAYSVIKFHKWYDLLSNLEREKIDWTYEMVKDVAQKYQNLKDFYTYDKKAYESAITNGWFEDITSHMKRRKFTRTIEDIKKIASQYEYLKDFYKNHPTEYNYAKHNGWLDDVIQNLKRLGNITKRAVYVWEFPDKSVYIGLTLDLKRRGGEHMEKDGASAVSKHILKTNTLPVQKIISDDYVGAEDAINLERCTIEKYRIDGWNILNRAKAGGLGCMPRIWTKERVAQEALKYDNSKDFKEKSKGAYSAAQKNKWLKDLTKHFKRLKRMGIYTSLSDDEIHSIAKKFKYSTDFISAFPSAYNEAKKRGIFDKITSHMTRKPGAGLHMKGRKHSDETRKKMSQTHKKRFNS
jgi:predicted GIY-YIG superfamily endonuclease